VRAAIALQETARLLQHLFHFIAHETGAAIKINVLFYCSIFVIAVVVSCVINAAIYFIATFILFYCT